MALEINPPRRDTLKAGRTRDGQMRALWRLTAWGGAAALALTALAATTQTEIGGERLKLALNPLADPTRVVAALPSRPAAKDPETRALEGEVRRLAADRDRLATRLSSLERHLDDLTGSIERQAAPSTPSVSTPPALPPRPAPVASTSAATAASIFSAADSAPHGASPSVSAAAVTGANTSDAIYRTPPTINPLALPPGSEREGWWPVGETVSTAAPPLAEAREIVPLPPTRLASQPPTRLAALPATRVVAAPANERHAPPPPVAAHHEYGIELAAAPDMEALRSQWSAVKANYGPLLAGLQPIALRDSRPGSKQLRLVAGPMANLAAARQACARLAAARAACRPASFTAAAVVQQ